MNHSSVKHQTVMVNNITIFDIVSHLICFHINFSNITFYIIVSLNISSFSKFTIIMSPKRSLGDILSLLPFLLLWLPSVVCDTYCFCSYYYYSYYSTFCTILTVTFLGDSLIKLYETLYEYHIACEVVPLSVVFFKMASVAKETSEMLKY